MPLLFSLAIHDALAEVRLHLQEGELLFAHLDDVVSKEERTRVLSICWPRANFLKAKPHLECRWRVLPLGWPSWGPLLSDCGGTVNAGRLHTNTAYARLSCFNRHRRPKTGHFRCNWEGWVDFSRTSPGGDDIVTQLTGEPEVALPTSRSNSSLGSVRIRRQTQLGRTEGRCKSTSSRGDSALVRCCTLCDDLVE